MAQCAGKLTRDLGYNIALHHLKHRYGARFSTK